MRALVWYVAILFALDVAIYGARWMVRGGKKRGKGA